MEKEKERETKIISNHGIRRTHGLVAGVSVILVVAVIVVVIITLPQKGKMQDLKEALSLGEKYLSELDYEQAIVSYRAAIEIDPQCVDAYIGLADTYIAMGNYDEAAKVLSQAEQMLRDREEGGENVSVSLEQIRRKIEELENLIRQREEEREALLKQQREDREALLRQQQKEEADRKLSLAERYLFASEYQKASEQFTDLLELASDRLIAYFGGVDAYLHLDKGTDATALLENGMKVMENKNFISILDGMKKSTIEGYIAIAEAFEAENLHERAVELLERVYRETGDEIIGRKLEIMEASQIEFREDYVIEWQDEEFERLIREYLGKETGDIHYDDVKEIEKIEILGEMIVKSDEQYIYHYSENWFRIGEDKEGKATGKIRTLKDLEHFTSLKWLGVSYQENIDISALAETDTIDCLLRLKCLSLNADKLFDITAISELSALESISVMYNNIIDILPIAMLIELTILNFNNNTQLTSLKPLSGLRKLQSVGAAYVGRVDLEVFSGLPELKQMILVGIKEMDYNVLLKLSLDYLEISCDDRTFTIIKQLKTLSYLCLCGGLTWNGKDQENIALTSIEGIGELENLKHFTLIEHNCHNLSPISSLTIETLKIDLLDDYNLNLVSLKNLENLKWISVTRPYYRARNDASNLLLEKMKDLLPDIEIWDTIYGVYGDYANFFR